MSRLLFLLFFISFVISIPLRRDKRQLGLGGYGYNSMYPYYSMYTGIGSYGLGGYGMGYGGGYGLGSSAYTFPLGGFGNSYSYMNPYTQMYG